MEVLELGPLAAHDYLLPSGFSAVDTAVGYSIQLAEQLVGLAGLPRVQAYFSRLTARPAYQRAHDLAPVKPMSECLPATP
jgi:glutathione S-transferase